MKNVYFESYGDCLGKMGSIMNVTVSSSTSYTYDAYGKAACMIWSPYKGSISIGGNTAELKVALTFTLTRFSDGIRHVPFVESYGDELITQA